MNLDRMSRRSLLGTGALLTIEKAIGPTSAAQPVDAEEATVLQEGLIVPWKLQVSDETLADLRERLKLTRFPNQLADVPWVYGTDLAFMRRLIGYWIDGYAWRNVEAQLNRLPHYMANVAGQRLHFIHQRGKGPSPVPLLITHGWPGLFLEMVELVGPLTDPERHGGNAEDAFDVVIPSIPGYAFSQHPGTVGLTPKAVADRFTRLMDRLGYAKFAVQGGDWDATISALVALQNPTRVTGLHMYTMGIRPFLGDGAKPITPEEKAYADAVAKWRHDGSAYQEIQSTRPQTLAYGLSDSPAGLAAWLVEKFRAWSDCHGEVERVFSKDQLLTNIMVFWVSGCIGSSMQLYAEQRRDPWLMQTNDFIAVPTA